MITKEPAPIEEAAVIQAPPALQEEPTQLPDRTPVSPDAVLTQEPGSEPVEIPDPLLPLDESDPQFSQSLADTLGSDTIQEYLVKGEVISRLVTMLDSLTSRQVPPLVNPVKAVEGEMIVESEGDQLILSPDNYARYDGYVQVLQNTDSAQMLGLYDRYKPLFQQAWQDNGGEGPFDQRLIEVIDELLDTPDVSGPVYLTKPEAFYLFEDPALESLTAGQKILIRMGNMNAEVVKQKLSEIKTGLQGE